ncbi:hypothetical protein EDB85DRAFT_1876645 [Lactarius pseudohatsudake]|nr:hypothetical protein EDB85DRAFT_1876645 [Lactarius pseudohatsudake]
MPRVGNQAFANWVDSHLGSQVTHINNRKDPIPIIPDEALGFGHASGKISRSQAYGNLAPVSFSRRCRVC